MKTIRILDSTGDRAITFDESPSTALARAEAKALFDQRLAGGAVAFKVNRGEGRPDERATEFSALENETVLIPRIVGG